MPEKLLEPLIDREAGTLKAVLDDEWYIRQNRGAKSQPALFISADQSVFAERLSRSPITYRHVEEGVRQPRVQKALEDLEQAYRQTVGKGWDGYNRHLWSEFQRFLSCLIPAQLFSTASATYARGLQGVLRHRFESLATAWREDTGHLSVDTDMTSHPAYLRIIGMGVPVLPLILEDLERTGDFWFTALEAITGEDPVPPESRGKIKVAVNAWLDWAKQHNLR
jgi:hypothetical protein